MYRTDAHKILGTTDKSTAEEIKTAYRRMAAKWHPDKNPKNVDEATAQFKKVQEAYEIISGERTAQPPPNSGRPNGFHTGTREDMQGGWTAQTINPEDLDEFIKRHFHGFAQRRPGAPDNRPPADDVSEPYTNDWSGGGPGARGNQRGPQLINALIGITLEEAFKGCTKTISVPNPATISGVPVQVQIPPGASEHDCVKQIETPETTVRCFIRINTGRYKVQFAGPFAVNGAGNCITEQKISPFLMMLGGFIDVPCFDGTTVHVRVPAGLPGNAMLKLQGKGYWTGIKCADRGDLFLRMVPEIQKLDEISEDRLREFKQSIEEHLKSRSKSTSDSK